jgi:hypothetical protein
VKTVLTWFIVVAIFVVCLAVFMAQMPGDSFHGGFPALSEDQQEIADDLGNHVDALARGSGTRGLHNQAALTDACDYLHGQLRRAGYDVKDQPYDSKGMNVNNIEVTLLGSKRPDDVIVIGAHYDTDAKSPGADANASGCAAVLSIARAMAGRPCERTIRFVLFGTGAGVMAGDSRSGAAYYAREAKKRGDHILAMLSLDSIGVYRDTPGSQQMGFPASVLYPDVGNYILFAGDMGSRDLVRACVGEFRKTVRFPCEGLAAPQFLSGIPDSDHLAFRTHGFPAIVVTDTGILRSDKTGTAADLPDKLDLTRMARVTAGLLTVVKGLGQRATSL